MPIKVIEESGHSLNGGVNFKCQYTILGTGEINKAKAALLDPGSNPDHAPQKRPEAFFGFLKIADIDGPHEVATETWKATVIWGPRPYPKPGEVTISWGARAGQVHVNRFLDIEDKVSIDGTSPNWSDLAIGVDSQGNAAGVDVPQGQPFCTLKTALEFGDVTSTYRDFLMQAAYDGLVNSTTFYDFAPGTLQFLSCEFSGTQRANFASKEEEPVCSLLYHFAVAPNFLYDPEREAAYLNATGEKLITGVTIPGMTRRLSKSGHAYVDVRTETYTVTGEAPPEGRGYPEDTLPGNGGVKPTEWKSTRPTRAVSGWLNPRIDYAKFGIGTSAD